MTDAQKSLKLAVLGATGRMGRTLIQRIAGAPDLELTAALEAPKHERLGADAGLEAGAGALNVPVSADLGAGLAVADGLIDFTTPGATRMALEATRAAGCFHIIGTTGFGRGDDAAVADAAKTIPIVKAGNFSLGVALLCTLVEQAAAALGPDFDIEIVDMHHRHKVDAPSGTALMLGEAAASGRGQPLDTLREPAREGPANARTPGGIGFAALRGGGVVGEHSVVLAGLSERLELTHRAEDRALFADGALRAARFAADADPGLYGMQEVLGLGAFSC